MKHLQDITRTLEELREGDPEAFDRLIPLAYEELRSLARKKMHGERPDHTLQPTALVNEAYLRLLEHSPSSWRSRQHFLAAAAQAMRHILIDHARKRASQKRGGDWQRVPGEAAGVSLEDSAIDLLDFGEALDRFAERYPRKANIVELRVFGGLTVAEVGNLLEIACQSVESHWSFAKAWLSRELRSDASAEAGRR